MGRVRGAGHPVHLHHAAAAARRATLCGWRSLRRDRHRLLCQLHLREWQTQADTDSGRLCHVCERQHQPALIPFLHHRPSGKHPRGCQPKWRSKPNSRVSMVKQAVHSKMQKILKWTILKGYSVIGTIHTIGWRIGLIRLKQQINDEKKANIDFISFYIVLNCACSFLRL